MESAVIRGVGNKRSCDVCGGELKACQSAFGVVLTCQRCQGKFGYYYRRDGEVLTYPRVWGKLVAVVQEPEQDHQALERVGVRRAPSPPPVAIRETMVRGVVFSPTYYVFLAEDGTLRRVRLASIPEAPKSGGGGAETVEYHHRWNVDVLPRSGNPLQRSEEKVVHPAVRGTSGPRGKRLKKKGNANGKRSLG